MASIDATKKSAVATVNREEAGMVVDAEVATTTATATATATTLDNHIMIMDENTGKVDENNIDDNVWSSGAELRLRRKIDWRLCTIAGILCSLNLLDSGIISSASVTSMLSDLSLTGNRYSVAIFIFTVASIVFQLPSVILLRLLGPRLFFSGITTAFGIITISTAFISTWRQMIALRILLGICMSGIYPGLTYLISTWYTRREQQLRYAFLQSGEVIILATGGIVNFGLNHLDHKRGLRGWQWMYLVQGVITTALGLMTYLWMVDFPERSHRSFRFLTAKESAWVIKRINADRQDAGEFDDSASNSNLTTKTTTKDPLTGSKVLTPFLDPKLYAFSILFFLLNIVSTALSYFLPIILQSGFGYSTNKSILLSTPPYYYSVIPVVLSSWFADRFSLRGPIITFNAICVIVGFSMFGFSSITPVRYIGTFLATGAYVSNWAALSAYQANNITGHWKRATVAAAVSACNGLGGIAGSYIVRSREAPHYYTAVWVSIGSHILMVCLVAACTIWFWTENRKQKAGRKILEKVEGWRYTY